MKKILFIVLLSVGYSCLAQQKKHPIANNTKPFAVTEKDVFTSMDENAATLMRALNVASISIGIVKNGKTYTKHYGEIDKGKQNKATNETLFEIASVTKIFTGTLMAKAVLDKKIRLEDDIRKYFVGSFPNLEYQGTPITIKDLVSFRSGFERDLPDREQIFKSQSDSIPFYLKKMEELYSKEQFLKELKTIKLDTLPGKVYKYSNASVELAAYILENVYQKSFETILKENLLYPLGLNNTKLYTTENEIVAGGYNGKNRMPYMSNSLWGASGYLKSSMKDLLKLLSFELNKRDKLSQESQRNLMPDGKPWNGYFWDRITVNNDGLNCVKHGGGFGTQNLFAVYPDFNMGISIIVNQSSQNTASYLHQALNGLVDDLKPYGKKDIGRAVYQKCVQNIDSGIQFYNYLKKNKPDLYNFSDESGLNSLGYKFIGNGQIASAIKIFKLLVAEFPNSGNAYDSLGEAYFNNKEYELSKASFLRSLELIPGNDNAKNMLNKIKNITK